MVWTDSLFWPPTGKHSIACSTLLSLPASTLLNAAGIAWIVTKGCCSLSPHSDGFQLHAAASCRIVLSRHQNNVKLMRLYSKVCLEFQGPGNRQVCLPRSSFECVEHDSVHVTIPKQCCKRRSGKVRGGIRRVVYRKGAGVLTAGKGCDLQARWQEIGLQGIGKDSAWAPFPNLLVSSSVTHSRSARLDLVDACQLQLPNTAPLLRRFLPKCTAALSHSCGMAVSVAR
jgi:hypothetical protein